MITPVEIQSKAFKSGIGYDKKDVDTFITEILESYEELYRSNVEMKDKINMLNEGLQHYKNIEASLQKALVLAEKTSEETIRTAELKAQTIEMEAVNKAKEHTADAKRELERVHSQTVTLVQQYTKYKTQFTQFLNAQMDLINSDAFKVDTDEFAAFAKTSASANDAYVSTNPMSDFVASGEQSQLEAYDTGEDEGRLGERDEVDAAAYNMDFGSSSTTTTTEALSKGGSGSFVDPFSGVNSNTEAEPEPEAETETPASAEEITEEQADGEEEAYEGEVEDRVEKRAMIGDEDEKSSGFTFI